MPNPWVSLRRDQLIPVNKAANEKEQLGKGLEEEEKTTFSFQFCAVVELILKTAIVYSDLQSIHKGF
jgi:hypothetical protein